MYQPREGRYQKARYNRAGRSGLMLPQVSLGLWHNFAARSDYDNCKKMLTYAFDHGITHFDLANNYGPPPGSAETVFGKILKDLLAPYRDELIISTKAGFDMWEGPYGDWGSKKYLVASLDQSLARMGLDYVDIFYHHRPDPETPIEETLDALKLLMRQGKALYVAISNYRKADTEKALQYARDIHLPILCNQLEYSLLSRPDFEDQQQLLTREGMGAVAYAPLAGGLLTDRYRNGIPQDSRIRTDGRFLKEADVTESLLKKLAKLDSIARERGQKLSQLSLAWVMAQAGITTALIGASRVEQIEEALEAAENRRFSAEELERIEQAMR